VVLRCDGGCGTEWSRESLADGGSSRDVPTITGARTDGMLGMRPLPDAGRPFHWCRPCSLRAFKAVARGAEQ